MALTGPGSRNAGAVKTLTVDDFTPGVVRFSRGGYPDTYGVGAPPGSASLAFRCWALPNVGLVPFPSYYPAQAYSRPSQPNSQVLSLGNMLPLPGANPNNTFDADSIVAAWFDFGAGNGRYEVTRANANYQAATPATGTSIFTSTGGLSPLDPWVSMDYGVFSDTAAQSYRRVVIMSDIYNSNWVTVGSWQSPASPPPFQTGALPGPSAYTTRLFFHEFRAWYLHASTPANDTAGFGGAGQDFVSVSGGASADLTMGNWVFAGAFAPELGRLFATWGSISSGELFLLYGVGGAVLLNGDPLSGSASAIKLPAVPGPGMVFGRAAQTAAGLIYATETDGAYLWNGDNTANKISGNVPDDELIRAIPAGGGIFRMHSAQAAWGAQAMFPNNWMYDTITGSWWQVEDPAVVNFQVHAPSSYGPKSFLSAPGFVIAPAGVAPTLTIYGWDRLTMQHSYVWVSNPLPVTQGDLVSLQKLELVASNPTPTDAVITITPTVPAGQAPLEQQTQAQPLTFRVPANTVGWRASHRLGYSDYNVQLRVDAVNTSATQPAPTVHQFTVSYTETRPSGVQ
jgi:hypothetical protein